MSTTKPLSTRKYLLPSSTKIDFNATFAKGESPMNSTLRGITIDSSFEFENVCDSIRFSDDGDSNKIDESE
jgi:hypothetical protein